MNRNSHPESESAKSAKKLFSPYFMQFKEGILDNNPILVQLLGTCPTLAVTTTVSNAVGMGIAATLVLICSNLIISLLSRFIASQIRIAAYIVIISGFVSAVELIISAYFPALNQALGVFIPLIVVNCIILARAEAFASKNKPLPSAVDGLSMGLGFTLGLILLSSLREILGAGTFLGHSLFGQNFQPVQLMVMPAGAFFGLGLIIAAFRKVQSVMRSYQTQKALPFLENRKIAAQPELLYAEVGANAAEIIRQPMRLEDIEAEKSGISEQESPALNTAANAGSSAEITASEKGERRAAQPEKSLKQKNNSKGGKSKR